MEISEIVTSIVSVAVTVAVGIISYFVKRTISDLDKCASKADLERLEKQINEQKQDIKTLNDKYATKAELREIKEDISDMRNSIDFIKNNTINREDFFRNISEVKDDIKDLKDFLMKK